MNSCNAVQKRLPYGAFRRKGSATVSRAVIFSSLHCQDRLPLRKSAAVSHLYSLIVVWEDSLHARLIRPQPQERWWKWYRVSTQWVMIFTRCPRGIRTHCCLTLNWTVKKLLTSLLLACWAHTETGANYAVHRGKKRGCAIKINRNLGHRGCHLLAWVSVLRQQQQKKNWSMKHCFV